MIRTAALTLVCGTFALFTSCKHADLRTPTVLEDRVDAEVVGRQLIQRGYESMGYAALAQTQSYDVTAYFDWNGIWRRMPMNGLPGNHHNDIRFRFATATFDGQVEFLEGRRQGTTYGLQSWQGYTQKSDEHALKPTERAKHDWALATYHYLLDSPLLMDGAEIIRYAGEAVVDDVTYDQVYVTWGSEEPNKEFDRLLLYYNQDTGFLDLMEVTINDFFLPMPPAMRHATVRYHRAQTEIGTWMPSHMAIQLGDPDPFDNNVYNIVLSDYAFDTAPIATLYPIPGLPYFGASKPE